MNISYFDFDELSKQFSVTEHCVFVTPTGMLRLELSHYVSLDYLKRLMDYFYENYHYKFTHITANNDLVFIF